MSQLIAIALGGAVGALARFGIALLAGGIVTRLRGPQETSFPWGTLLANLLGAFLMGYLFHLFLERSSGQEFLRPLLTTGFLGALTTFSTFALEAILLWQSGATTTAVFYIASSNILGLAAVWLGFQIMN